MWRRAQASRLIDNGSLINVVRFANTTRRSQDLRQLLQTVVAQLSAALCPATAATVAAAIMEPSVTYDDVLAHFRCLLDTFPARRNLMIFIDGVDRVTDVRGRQVCSK